MVYNPLHTRDSREVPKFGEVQLQILLEGVTEPYEARFLSLPECFFTDLAEAPLAGDDANARNSPL